MNIGQGNVVEIIGLCGAGKSTLAALLNVKKSGSKAGLTIWGLPKRLLLKSSFTTLPSLVKNRLYKKLSSEEIKQIVRINAFTEFVKRQDYSSGTFFFDEGAIFAISKLRVDSQNDPILQEEWEAKSLNHWKELVKTIIWLDSADEVLIQRIRQRNKSHRMKDKSDDEIVEFLSRYREAYEIVIKKFTENNAVNILKFDTAERNLKDIADEISFKIVSNKASQREVLPTQQIEVGL